MRTAQLIRPAAVAAAVLGLVLVASPALAAASRAPAAMTDAAAAVGVSAILQVGTVPVVPGARVILDGVTHLTDATGKVTIGTYAGRHRLQVLPPRAQRPGSTVRFSRWLDGIALASRSIGLHQGMNRQQAGFELSYPISVRFTNGSGRPVPLSAVKRITMASSLGQRFTFAPGQPPRRLAANRIVRDQFGLHALPIRYSVRNVIFSGANVVYGGSQSFFVGRHRVWTVRLLLFPMHIEVHDALFGFGVGSAIRLRLGGGSSRIIKLGAGHSVTLSGMPRATYELVAKGPGFGLSSPATLTKPLDARLLLLSWIDIAAVAAFALLFLIGLPVLGGRIRRRKDGARLPGWHIGHPEEPPPAERLESPEPAVAEPAADEPVPTGSAAELASDEPIPDESATAELAAVGPAAEPIAAEPVAAEVAAERPATADEIVAAEEPAGNGVRETIVNGNGAAPGHDASRDLLDLIPRSDVASGMGRRVTSESAAGAAADNGSPQVATSATARAYGRTSAEDEASWAARLAWAARSARERRET
jgi:hypothetical protein